jgi:hypothetical protein
MHDISPAAHPAAHVPAEHDSPRMQALPQEPQSNALVRRSTHWPPHIDVPAAQVHAPATQLAPVEQALPQLPQLNGSVATSTQAPVQAIWPAAHVIAHAPAEQT